MANFARCAESLDTPEINAAENPSGPEPETPQQKKKFFSILEKNTDSEAEKTEKASKENENKEEISSEAQSPMTNVQVDSDIIEYFPDRH